MQFVCLLLCLSLTVLKAQSYSAYGFMSWNVENAFDTLNNPRTGLDNSFLPQGKHQWNSERYWNKIQNITYVLRSQPNTVCIGLSEIESHSVLHDILATAPSPSWKSIHRDSPDPRGIDVALLIDTQVCDIQAVEWYYPRITRDSQFSTREYLYVRFVLNGVEVNLVQAHWPSRSPSIEASTYKREAISSEIYHFLDSIQTARPKSVCFLMGDLNDEVQNASVQKWVKEGAYLDAFQAAQPYLNDTLVKGTYKFNNAWYSLDHILYSRKWHYRWLFKRIFPAYRPAVYIDPRKTHIVYLPAQLGFAGSLAPDDPRYGTGIGPFRTYIGTWYKGGPSDHLPIYLEIQIAD